MNFEKTNKLFKLDVALFWLMTIQEFLENQGWEAILKEGLKRFNFDLARHHIYNNNFDLLLRN